MVPEVPSLRDVTQAHLVRRPVDQEDESVPDEGHPAHAGRYGTARQKLPVGSVKLDCRFRPVDDGQLLAAGGEGDGPERPPPGMAPWSVVWRKVPGVEA